jgi:hypothetical protein
MGLSQWAPYIAIIVVVLGGAAAYLWYSGLIGPRQPNARCPHCLTSCHIRGLEGMTFHQKAAVRHRCPTCGHMDDVIVFEILAGRGQPPPPENQPENIIVP